MASTAAIASARRTSGIDVIGRHAFTANRRFRRTTAAASPETSRITYPGSACRSFSSTRRRTGRASAASSRATRHRVCSASCFVARWNADALATWIRQRYRTAITLSAGAGVEQWDSRDDAERTDPGASTRPARFGTLAFPSLIAGASFANYQRPPFSISPEDGMSVSATVRDRLAQRRHRVGRAEHQRRGIGGAVQITRSSPASRTTCSRCAARSAGPTTTPNGYFSVGGVSGITFQIIPGYVLGEGRNTFPVRGFRAGHARRHARADRVGGIPHPAVPRSAAARGFCRSSSTAARSRCSATMAPRGVPNVRAGRAGLQSSGPGSSHRHRLRRRGAESQPRCVLVGFAVPLPARRRALRRRMGILSEGRRCRSIWFPAFRSSVTVIPSAHGACGAL